jgi:hypothetical protein
MRRRMPFVQALGTCDRVEWRFPLENAFLPVGMDKYRQKNVHGFTWKPFRSERIILEALSSSFVNIKILL